MFGFFVLIAAIAYGVSWYYGDFYITIFALIFAFFYILWTYFASDKLALAVNSAHEIAKKDNPRLWNAVENLTIATGSPMPKSILLTTPRQMLLPLAATPNMLLSRLLVVY